MGKFAVFRERSSRSLEKVGRFRIEGENIVRYLDGMGTYQVRRSWEILVLLRLGDEVIRDLDGGTVGMMSLSGSGKGVKMVIQERLYVAPGRRVKQVLEGKEKKGAVFGVKLM
ncbi:hypothetical protein ACKUB1_16270 [Methanospirillum stamsii]|uniref:Uncharacterized protein n=1 Tax=Methanospirillum stamsii TaxID=1277351 RepID=A0A2V2N5F6_9EURY|nr:hypothetical protein [Methanospirillum stamsii]PWR75049.1 hypothetical protein DLD82_07480 [Methanospirillum stamsii]